MLLPHRSFSHRQIADLTATALAMRPPPHHHIQILSIVKWANLIKNSPLTTLYRRVNGSIARPIWLKRNQIKNNRPRPWDNKARIRSQSVATMTIVMRTNRPSKALKTWLRRKVASSKMTRSSQGLMWSLSKRRIFFSKILLVVG